MKLKVYNEYRSKYNQMHQSKICPFCNPIIIKKQEIKYLEDDNWRVMVNDYPYLDGNMMIVSKRHVVDIKLLTGDEWKTLFKKLKEVEDVLSNIFNTKSFNIGLNIGKNSGGSIRHLHWQIIPRINSHIKEAFTDILTEIQIIKISPKKLIQKINHLLREKK